MSGLIGHLGPLELPGGSGTLTAADRADILAVTGCSAAVRERQSWGGRKLTLTGPPGMLETAHNMAMERIRMHGDTGGRQQAQQPRPQQTPRREERLDPPESSAQGDDHRRPDYWDLNWGPEQREQPQQQHQPQPQEWQQPQQWQHWQEEPEQWQWQG